MIEKQLRGYILPNILAMTAISCYVLADTFFVAAAESADGITALNLTLPIYAVLFAIGAMIGIGSATRFALHRATGQKDAETYFSGSLFWTLVISAPFVVLGALCPGLILRLMGGDDTIVRVGTGYLRVVLLFAPCFMLNYTFTAFVRNDGAPRMAMAATLSSSLFNIVFDYVLMFPCGLGIVGAALATGISPIVSMLVCLIHYLSKRNTIRLCRCLPSVQRLFSACKLGVVAFVGEIASGITTMVFNFLLLGLAGNVGVAAYAVIANIALVGTAMFNGVSQGLQPLASQSQGRPDDQRVILRSSLRIGLGLATALVVLIWTGAGPIVSLFNRDGDIQLAAYAVPGLRLYIVGFFFAALNLIRAGYFSATGRGGASSVIALSRGVVAIVLFAFVLSALFGITGIWLAFPAAEICTLLLSIPLSRRLDRQSMA